jgi:hypothetical protein
VPLSNDTNKEEKKKHGLRLTSLRYTHIGKSQKKKENGKNGEQG